ILYVITVLFLFFFFQAEDGIRDFHVTGVQTCALPISRRTQRRERVPPLPTSTFRESLWTPWGLGSRQAQKLEPWAHLLHRRRPRDGGRASQQDPSPSDLTARDAARPASALVFDEVATATTGPKSLRHEAHTAPPICTRKGPRRYHPPGS